MGDEYSLKSEKLDVSRLYLVIKQMIEQTADLKLVFSNENHCGFKESHATHSWRADIEIEKLEHRVYLILHNGKLQNILSILQMGLAAQNLDISIEELE